MHRRFFLQASLALAALGLPGMPAFSAPAADDGQGEPFSFAKLKARAKALAGKAYQSPAEQLPPELAHLTPQQYQKIQYKRDHALWAGNPHFKYRIHFFHTGMGFDVPVRMYAVNPDTQRAKLIPFSPDLFDYSGSGIDPSTLQGKHLGFAGFQLSYAPHAKIVQQAAAYLGASYFRAIDKNKQYGLSARGLAIDTDVPSGEEFPDFTDFWFVRPRPGAESVTVYALLNSPSVAGAYRFDISWRKHRPSGTRDPGTTMNVTAELYIRKAIKRLGLAPMTSMFLKGTSQPCARETITPLMHDSDRLVMWRGNGEWICRPLYNPPTIQYNTFADENPHGFGLVQHDHKFADYRDPITWYNRRPSLWVEPTNGWGKGAVALMEMPTVGETVDNIVAFWVPKKPVTAGEHLSYGYKLFWWPEPPVNPSLAVVDKTWSGMGNVHQGWIPGDHSPKNYARRFAVDFVGPPLDRLDDNAKVEAQVSLSHGKLGMVTTQRMAPINGWRAVFDWEPESDSTDPVTLRLYLHSGKQTLTETWLYQWVPPRPADRHY